MTSTKLIVFDEFQHFLQAVEDVCRENYVFVGAGSADIGGLFGFGGIYYKIVATRMQADDLAFISVTVKDVEPTIGKSNS